MSLATNALAAGLLFATTSIPGAAATRYACAARPPPGPSWTQVRQTADMRLYQRDTSGGLPEAAARVRWQAEPRELYRLVWEYEHFAGVIPNIGVSNVLERDEQRVWVYQRLDFPAPVRDRHYVLESTDRRSEPAHGRYRIEWRLSERFDLPGDADAVPPAAFRGCWDIRPSPGGLDAVYRITLDPGGLVPHWLSRHAMRGYLIELMTALHRKLESGKAR